MKRAVAALLLLSVPTAGCYPTLPPFVGESTEVLQPKQMGVRVMGGGAMFATNCCKDGSTAQPMGGLETRFRIGVGAKQEVGASFFGGIGGAVGGGDPPFVIGGKGTWKIAPVQWLAVIANGGGQVVGVAAVATFGGDLAVIAAPYTSSGGTQLYTGVKGGLAIPVLNNATATSEAFTIPIGLSLATSERVRLLFESGGVLGLSQTHTGGASGGTQSATSPGGYGLVAFSFNFR
jgi:hypothetical protein